MDDNKTELELLAERAMRGALAIGALFSTPFLAFGGFLERLIVALRDLVKRFRPEDPYHLRVNGETLLSDHVKIELGFLGLLISCELAFEQFAWSSMWGYSLVGVVAVGISLAFTLLTYIQTRAILTMDDSDAKKRNRVVVSRLGMLALISLVIAVPAELRFFHSEIEKYISAQEQASVTEIRATAKAYETDLADEQKTTATDPLLTGTSDIARRDAGHDKIEKRLADASKAVTRIASGAGVNRRTAATALSTARKQEAEIRAELQAYDAETERLRAAATDKGVAEIGRRDVLLTEKLHAIEVMTPDELVDAYGGNWKRSRGFMDELRAYLTILRQPDLDENGAVIDGWFTNNQKISAIVALMMVLFGLAVVFVKVGLMTKPTQRYFSQLAQALAGNEKAIDGAITDALSGDEAAIKILRMVARDSEKAKVTLAKLGYNGDVEVAGWDPAIRELHGRLYAAQGNLNAALGLFRGWFRFETGVKEGLPPVCRTRAKLSELAERRWNEEIVPKVIAIAAIEREFDIHGVRVPAWPTEFAEKDPRHDPARLWRLGDDELAQQFGWEDPALVVFANAPRA